MKIREKLLGGFLLVSALTLIVSYCAGLLVQERTVANFDEVAGKTLPGNVALAQMTSELYHALFLLAQYAEQPDEATKKKIEQSISILGTYKTMHQMYHPADEALHARIEGMVEEFNRSVASYLLLVRKNPDPDEVSAARRKIDNMLEVFLRSINPHIEKEFPASLRKLQEAKEMTAQARKAFIISGIAILLVSLILSFFIAHLLTTSLRTLSTAARQIGAGRLDLSLPATTSDELSDLIREFNQMAINLSGMRTDLLTAQKFTANIVDSMADSLVVINPAAVIVSINSATRTLLGYREHELLGKTVWSIVESPELQATDLAEQASKNQIINLDVSYLTRSGQKIPMALTCSAVRDEQGELLALVLVARDFTEINRLVTEINKTNQQLKKEIVERIQARDALAAEKEQLAVTLRSIGDGVITTDTHCRVVVVNKAAEDLTGWSQDEARGQPFAEVCRIIDAKTRTRCATPIDKALAAGQTSNLADFPLLVARDGTERRIAETGAPIRDRDGQTIGAVLVFRDVTDEERREAEQIKVKKLESIGILAGGIAHDFNNFLAAILGNISLARNLIPAGINVHGLLEEAEKASLRARDLTQQLLTFSKGGEPVKKLADIGEIIKESSQFVLRGSGTGCVYHLADDLWPVEIDYGQISQVIQNLVINADHAMPEGGTIEIQGQNLTAEAARSLAPELHRPCVMLTVRDQGVGIPPELLDRIFDPYFSTKSMGSGLGLAISHSIIKKHRGHITATSKPGEGTTFTILLPASVEKGTALPLDRHEAIPPSAGPLRILLMDDDEQVRDMSGKILAHLGHKVMIADDGHAAINLYQQSLASDSPVDLIIMDLTIPGGMGGKEAAKQILAINDRAKIIASSGYSNDPVLADPEAYGFSGALRKPYDLMELAEVLAKM
jgi:PAS domain S-box-containing protein